MKLLSTGALAGLLFVSALFQGTSAADWDFNADYDVADCTASSLSALTLGSSTTCPTSPATCASNNKNVICTSDSAYKTKIASVFTSTKYVTVSTYASSKVCSGTPSSVTAYAVTDSSTCHRITLSSGLAYFKVTGISPLGGAPVNAAKIEFYSKSDCSSAVAPSIDIPVTKAALTAGCDNPTAAPSTKIEVSANWPAVSLTGTVKYASGTCGKAGSISVAVTATTATCTSSNCAAGTAPRTGTICTNENDIGGDILDNMGSLTPYVTISTFSAASCAAVNIKTSTTYAADGGCHPLGTKYFKVITVPTGVTSSTGTVATIQSFTDSACTNSDSSNTPDVVVTSTQLGSGGCVSTTGTNPTSTLYKKSNLWPTAQKAITTFDNSDCSALGFVSVASGCTSNAGADAQCDSGAAEICTSNFNYEAAIAAKFPSATYLTIADFSGGSGGACTGSALSGAKVYVADNACHKYSSGYYNLSAVPLGGVQEPKIYFSTDEKCSLPDTNANSGSITVARQKLIDGCDTTGPTLYKVSANWPKAMSVSGVGTYTAPASGATCSGGTPSRLTLTENSVTGNACTAKTCKDGSFTDCTTFADYSKYLKTAFGTAPYVIKETYTGSGCGTLSGVTAWAADGTCIVDGKNSYKIVATSSGLATRTWTNDLLCATASPTDTVLVTAANLAGSICVGTTKYSMGGSWAFTSNAAYDDSKCALTPSKLSLSLAPLPAGASCTTPTADSCVSTTPTTPENAKTGNNAPGCVKMTSADYFSAIDKAFGMTTYVVQEMYSSCGGSLAGVTAYVADGTCHVSGDAASSYKVTYDPSAAAAAAAVKIETFTSQDCLTGAATPVTVLPAALTARTCDPTLFTKTYVGGLATQLTAVTMYSDKDCKNPVQTVFSSTASTCTPVTTCTAGTKTACTKANTDYNAILATVYGTTRRLVSDVYEAKDSNKCGTRQGIIAYVGDGICHAAIDGTSFTATLGSSNTATDATLTAYTDKNCTKEPKALTISAANLASGTTAPCDNANSNGYSFKWSINGTEPATEAPATAAPTPAPTTAVSTGSGKSAAVSSFSVSIFGLLASILGGLAVLLN